MASPAIRWTRKGDRSHERYATKWGPDGTRIPAEDAFGRQLKERTPVTGRVGVVRQSADIENTKAMRDVRALHFLRTDGNEAHMPVRSSAASPHGEQGTDRSQLEFIKARARHEGWILVGACPVDLVLRRERHRLQMFSPAVREAIAQGEACPPQTVGADKPPCRHYVAERDTRRAIRAAENKAQNDAQTPAAERTATSIAELVARMPVQTFAPAVAPQVAQPAEPPPVLPEPPSTEPPKGAGKAGK